MALEVLKVLRGLRIVPTRGSKRNAIKLQLCWVYTFRKSL